MEKIKQKYSRKKFVMWGISTLASFSILKFGFSSKKKRDTVKLLSQDGKLVEVDMSLLQKPRRRVTNDELQNWVKK